jgi:cytochrome c oxidase subunit 2
VTSDGHRSSPDVPGPSLCRRPTLGPLLLRQAGGTALVLGTALLSGCVGSHYRDYPQTTLEPITEYGWGIQRLFELILWMAAVVFVAVEGWLIYTVWRYRWRPGQPRPKQIHGNTRFEIAWTIAPAIVLAIIAVPTVQTIFHIGGPPPPASFTIQVIGHQWWWEFRYPELGIVTANEVHMPVGKTVNFEMTSADVIHAFWFPRLGGKRDVVPTHTSHIWLDTPREPSGPEGYPGQCAEFCGASHANMRMRAFVDSEVDFEAWVSNQQKPAGPPLSAAAARGAQLFQQRGCAGCHTVAGTEARGEIGPNLTHIGSRVTIAAGVLDNKPDDMARWLSDPPAVKPGSLMPKLGLSDPDIEALIAYLDSLR